MRVRLGKEVLVKTMEATNGLAKFASLKLVLSIVAVLALAGCQAKERGNVAAQFDVGRDALMHGDFATAAPELSRFIEEHADHHLAGRATFLLAKCKLGQGELGEAAQWFQRTVERFPKSEEAHKAKYKLAVIDLLQGDAESAIEKLQRIVDQPDGPYVPEATAYLAFLKQAAAHDAP